MNKSLLESTRNTREICPGLWRSDALTKLTDNDLLTLKQNNIFHNIDMRALKVCEWYPCSLFKDTEFAYDNVPINLAEQNQVYDFDFFCKVYHDMLYHPYTETVLQIIYNSPVGVVFNCTAGKDRTGVIAMLTEYSLGYDNETIIKHYLDSIDYLGDYFEEFAAKHHTDVGANLPRREYAEIVLSDEKTKRIRDSMIGKGLRKKFKI